LEIAQTIAATPTFAAADRLIVATIDGYVYCLQPSRQSSNILWKFSSGETLSQSPLVNGEFVYVLSGRSESVLAVDPGWLAAVEVARRQQDVGDQRGQNYAVGEVGRLVVLDLKNGKPHRHDTARRIRPANHQPGH
jgi:hypothetical protein